MPPSNPATMDGRSGVVVNDPFINSVDGDFVSLRQILKEAVPAGVVHPTSPPPSDDVALACPDAGNPGSASTTPSDATSPRFYTPEDDFGDYTLDPSPTVGRQLNFDGDDNDDDRRRAEQTGDVMYMPDLFFELFFDVRFLPYCHLSEKQRQLPPQLMEKLSPPQQLSRGTSESSFESAVAAAPFPSPVPPADDGTGSDGENGRGDEVALVERQADPETIPKSREAEGMETPTLPHVGPSDDRNMKFDPSPSTPLGGVNRGVDSAHPGSTRNKTRNSAASRVLRKIRKSLRPLSPRKKSGKKKKDGARTGRTDGDEEEMPQSPPTPTHVAADSQLPSSPGSVEEAASARTVTLSSPGSVKGSPESSSPDVNMVDIVVQEDKSAPTTMGGSTAETSVTSSNDAGSDGVGIDADSDHRPTNTALQRSFIRVCDLNLSDDDGAPRDRSKRWCSISPSNHPDELSDVLERLSRNGLEYAAGGEGDGESRAPSKIQWKPTPDTDKFLRKSGRGPSSTLTRDMERHGRVLVWSGTVPHDGHGSEIPMAKARGIVRNATPRQLLDLLLDSGRVRAYNKMSMGREDVSFLQRGVHTVPSRSKGAGASGTLNVPGEVKLVRSRSRIPVINHQLELLNMIYARDVREELMEMECCGGGRGEGGGGDGGNTEAYLAVSRAVNDKLSWGAIAGGDGRDDDGDDLDSANGGSEMLFGVNLMRSVDGAETEPMTEFTCVTHVNSPLVPVFLAKRLGLKSAANFIHDVQAYFEHSND